MLYLHLIAMSDMERFEKAISSFDAYNALDPNLEVSGGSMVPKELLYARRMSERLEIFASDAPEHVKLAIRCQHIGRWEMPRNRFEMNRKGYLQWRSQLKIHHASLAERILSECGYDQEAIHKVQFLLLKKQLSSNAETQVLEDVVCLVFLEFYLEDFASKHEEDKVVDILNKTLKKMSPEAIDTGLKLPLSERVREYLSKTNVGKGE